MVAIRQHFGCSFWHLGARRAVASSFAGTRILFDTRGLLGALLVITLVAPAGAVDAAKPDNAKSVAAPWHQVISATGQIDFANDIVPIITKAGCNAGTCHAKAGGGQNGFELSLLGFEPDVDYQFIVVQGRGRRIFPAAPESSLLIRKALGEVPHGGGPRLQAGSAEYQVLVEWIRHGCPETGAAFKRPNAQAEPAASSDGPVAGAAPWEPIRLATVEVMPSSALLEPQQTEQLRVVASYSDGSSRDVTDLALFESNDTDRALVDRRGLVTAGNVPGTAAIMVRYQGHVAVFRPAIPLGPALGDLPTPMNLVDEHLFSNLQRLGIPPALTCDDATYLRRVSLDLTGRLPTDGERQSYWAADARVRRAELVEQLLKHPDYAEYFANKWTSLLKNRREDTNDLAANFAFHAWVRDHLQAGTPYDQMVKQLLAATGTIKSNPAVAWYKRVKDPKEQLEDISQLFLGVRLQCAQCHHHPFERWSQDDYYALSACFSRVGRKPTGVQNEDMIFHQRGIAEAQNLRTGQTLRPKALGADLGRIDASEDPRLKLADWMRLPDNPFFAKALVNRYWKHFFRVGLVEPEDDIRDSNPPSNPELLTALECYFINSDFNLRDLARTLVLSNAYQLSSQPNDRNLADTQNYSRFYPRRLPAEVLLDVVDQLLGSQTSFANLPPGTRAVGLPDNSYNRAVPFLKVFGRPENSSVCECERVQSANLAQSLHLLNSAELKAKLGTGGGLADKLAQSSEPFSARIEHIYQVAFCRSPRSEELAAIEATVPSGQASKADFEDVLWAVLNSKEFLFNH
ncbi:MAG: DUF1553 domain-containing protein [Pirellulaceae bacterium]|nr:DUF1553 domain-containing protein [Pirellulaceae bacterium]